MKVENVGGTDLSYASLQLNGELAGGGGTGVVLTARCPRARSRSRPGARTRPGAGRARLGQPVWTFRAERTADSRAPSIQAGLIEVWSPAKCSGPSEVGMSGNSSVCWPGKSTDASP